VSRLVLRFAKRRASWEEPTAAGVREIEFTNRKTGVVDLRPSVYAVDEGEVLRAYAEHAAAAPIDPEAAPLGIDLGGMKLRVEASDGSIKFQLTRTRHAEIVVEDVAALDALIDIARTELPARSRNLKKADVRKFVQEKLAAGNEEWSRLAEEPTCKDWVKKLRPKPPADPT